MNKAKVFFYAGSFFLFLLVMAYAFDGSGRMDSARNEVVKADQELKRNEDKLVAALSGLPDQSPGLGTALEAYRLAEGIGERHERYQSLVAEVRKHSAKQVDVDNPLIRRFADEIAGAINRRDIAERNYQESLLNCESVKKSQSTAFAIKLGMTADGCED